MKQIVFLFILLPYLSFSEIEPVTYLKIISNKAKTSIEKNKSKLNMNFYAPNGEAATRNILVIIDKDTICNENITTEGLQRLFDSGSHQVQVYSKYWHSVSQTIDFKSQHHLIIEVHFEAKTMELEGIEYDYDKPVIYFYPEKEEQIKVQLNLKGKLKFTYPEYNSGWNFTATPEGTIRMNGKEYGYLFWDGNVDSYNVNVDFNSGVIVPDDNLVNYFETTLTKIGLSSKEQQDFITYWVPQMKNTTPNYIYFVFNEEYNEIAELNVNPKPDRYLRVFMFWKELSSNVKMDIMPQEIPSFNRNGFTVVEWGGCKIPKEIELTSK